ncbi:MAG: hypothetical protein CVU41_13685 [Chloroflexi bacterium HGW-Chloroflexi-3]|nr:MAG: hypothetical protein CVU41_13685 [Chloroflexi bacterium HGW-Chloroflexi-3]
MNHFWSYILVIFLVAINGEAAILLAASIASVGYLNPFIALGAVTLGNVLSDSAWFALGYYGKIDWLLKRSRWLGIKSDNVDLAFQVIRKDTIKLLVFSKLTNWITIPALIATGFAKVSWKKWFPTILISNLLIGVVLMSLGYFMTAKIMEIQNNLRIVAILLIMVFILISIFYLRKLFSKNNRLLQLADPKTLNKDEKCGF